MVRATDYSGHLPDKPWKRDAALVERPFPVDAARRAQRQRHRPLFDRLFPQPEPGDDDRLLAELRLCDDPPRYPPALYRDLVLDFYRANYFHQKGHRSAAAAQAAQ
jgi:hypothetical protein